jgi:hypothetical protein
VHSSTNLHLLATQCAFDNDDDGPGEMDSKKDVDDAIYEKEQVID